MFCCIDSLSSLIHLSLIDLETTQNSFEVIWQKLLTDRWVWVGYGGQAIFFSRWIVQWFVSEKAGKSEIPIAFWWLSITGGCITLLYAYVKAEPVLFLGQILALLMYTRNLMLVYRTKK
ncbi:MAG: lipid-A-disaccharide synthase N-terminal domain-containing protein [Planctomycetota bacterium]